MEGIIHIRIDDRLIHGQVAGLWLNELKATRVMVINDQVAQDEVQKSLLRMVAPGNINTSIISEEKAYENISQNKYCGQRVMVLVKSPEELTRLVDKGLTLGEVNIGNMSSRADTEVIFPGVSVTKSEKDAFLSLLDKGTKITFRKTPSDHIEVVTSDTFK